MSEPPEGSGGVRQRGALGCGFVVERAPSLSYSRYGGRRASWRLGCNVVVRKPPDDYRGAAIIAYLQNTGCKSVLWGRLNQVHLVTAQSVA